MNTKFRDPISDDEIENRLRAAYAAIVPLIEGVDSSSLQPQPRGQARSPRLPMAIACSVIVALGVMGAVVVATRDNDQSAQTSSGDAVVAGERATTRGAGLGRDRAEQIQWFLPTALPEGYELTDISAELRVDGTANPDVGGGVESVGPGTRPIGQTWIRRAADGRSEDTITVEAVPVPGSGGDGSATPVSPPAQPDSHLIGEPNATVHGLDAVVIGPPVRESPGFTVNWVEDDVIVTIQVTGGVSREEALVLGEATTVVGVNASVDPAALPTGFEVVPVDASAPVPANRREAVTLVVTAETGSIRVRVDTPAVSTVAEASVDETERRTIDGIDYSLFESSDTMYARVVWFADGRQYVAEGDATIDDVMALATGLRAASRDDAAAAAEAITAATQTLPTVATATLDDGVEVSVHGPADDNVGVVGICVDTPKVQCVRPDRELGQLGVPGLTINAVFHIGDARRAIAWNGTEPELSDAETPMPDLIPAASGTGWFIDQETPAGEPLRRIDFRADDGSLTGVYPIDAIRP